MAYASTYAKHYDELEADFQQYYNLDISTIKNSRASRLMFQLPHNSRTFKKINPASEWGWKELYLAKAVDGINTLIWMNSKDAKNKSKRPKTVIPDSIMKEFKKANSNNSATSQNNMTVEDMKAYLNRPRR